MTSPEKRKGDGFERAVVTVLRDAGHLYAERAYGAGRPADVGDIDGLPGFVIECKAHRALDLAGWVDEAIAEAGRVGDDVVPVVVAKRRGKPTERAYVVLELATFARLIAEASL